MLEVLELELIPPLLIVYTQSMMNTLKMITLTRIKSVVERKEMANKSKFTDAEIRGMQVMRKLGKTYLDIGIAFHCSQNTTHRLLQKNGEPKSKKNKYPPLTIKQIKKIEQGFLDYKTHKQIAEELDIPLCHVRDYLSNNKIKAVGKKRNSKKPLVFKQYSKFLINVPCPIEDCSNRKSCTEIDNPRQCEVWQLVFVKHRKKDRYNNCKYPITER